MTTATWPLREPCDFERPTLIVLPLHLVRQWMSEIRKFVDTRRVVVSTYWIVPYSAPTGDFESCSTYIYIAHFKNKSIWRHIFQFDLNGFPQDHIEQGYWHCDRCWQGNCSGNRDSYAELEPPRRHRSCSGTWLQGSCGENHKATT